MIVTGGENVYSAEVEKIIYQHPAVLEAAVFGIPDPQWGELVMAIVTLKPGMTLNARGQDLITFCKQSLAHYKVPRRIEFTKIELPKSGSGKILKRVLCEKFWSQQKPSVA
jgi:long-chain acyl-CoA synthetase